MMVGLGVVSCSKNELESPSDTPTPSSINKGQTLEGAVAVPDNQETWSSDPSKVGKLDINDDGDDESGPRNPPKDKDKK